MINLQRRDLLLESIEEKLKQSGIKNAVITSAIDSLQKAHFHMVISDPEPPYTGHLENGTVVLYLAEISLLKVTGLNLERVKDENNIAILTEKK